MTSTFAREANAVVAIAWRDVLKALKSPAFLAITILFPVIFMGILGGSVAQNLAGGLGFDYMRFILVGMVVATLYQITVAGVTSLVEDRETDFTQEIFVSPVSRYSIILGKILGSSGGSLIALIGVFATAVIMGVQLDAGDVARLLVLAPILCLAGGALGVLFIGFVQDPKTASIGAPLLVFPQLFLAGALIPVANSTGILAVLSHLMPLTYAVDLARAIFYAGRPEYGLVVVNSPALDVAVTVACFVAFTLVGTFFFARAEKNR